MNQNTLIDQYKSVVVKIIEIKSKINELDTQNIWKYTFPKVAASKMQIDEYEIQVKYKLPEPYRDFLLVANGWDAFFQYNDLLGVDYMKNEEYYKIAKETFFDLAEAQIEGYNKADLVPIAVNKFDKDIFLMDKSNTNNNGKILWFAGELIEEWDSFKEFILSMIMYNQRILEQIINKKSG